MNDKVVFIIPYFGKFNNYFPLFLLSCKYNSDFNWLIFTDDETNYEYPSNVKVIYKTFEEIKSDFQRKFDFAISLEKPYKLCDYKVSYGYVFYDYIREFDAWGHCDTDLIWGDISKFVTDEDINQYDKIGILGHCTIYKNNENINQVFMKNLSGNERYKEVFTSNQNHSFDEEFKYSINNIFEEQGLSIKYTEYEANIYTKSSNFKIITINSNKKSYSVEKKKNAFFVWDNGKLYRVFLQNKEIHKKEYLYIHMQSRPMQIRVTYLNRNNFKIIPNSFDDLEYIDVTVNNFNKFKKKHFNLHYFILRTKNLIDKLKRRIK